tara:strand:- start:1356 stop:2138 length:783 start_codon:yes stop_codon:yes gene_type:complete
MIEKNKDDVIVLKNVSKTFSIREKKQNTIRSKIAGFFGGSNKRKICAVKNVSLKVKKGEFLGIIGRNGSGKSTLIHLMTGAYPVDKGGFSLIKEKYMRLSLGMGFNQELTARQNIYVNASIMGLTFREIDEKFNEIIEFSELKNFVNTKIKFFSKGMKSRLSFAIAIHAKADIFLMDEFFGGVGDERFKSKANEVFKQSILEGRTIIHVSHGLGTIKQYCDRVVLMEKGEIYAIGNPEDIIPIYKELSKQKKTNSLINKS